MRVVIQKSNSSDTIKQSEHVYLQDNVLFADGQIKRPHWEIASVRGANLVSIVNYYGSETKDITGEDIYAINEEVATLYCDRAMQFSDRVSLYLKSGTSVEIHGQIISCQDL